MLNIILVYISLLRGFPNYFWVLKDQAYFGFFSMTVVADIEIENKIGAFWNSISAGNEFVFETLSLSINLPRTISI